MCIRDRHRVIDLCTGTGIVSFLVYGKYKPQEVIGLEIQDDMVEMANRSSKLNDTSEMCIRDSPDIYLLAAKKLNVDPSECMVFEDIIAAARGAKLAGMKVTGVFDEHSNHQTDILKEECDNYRCV